MNRSYLYVERSLQEVLLSGEKKDLEQIRKRSLNVLRANRVAYLSREHFHSMQRAWNKDTTQPIHSAVGETILIPNLDLSTKENSVQLFMDLTKLLIIDDRKLEENTEKVLNTV